MAAKGSEREDRRAGQEHGSKGQPIDEKKIGSDAYREGLRRGRAAEVNRQLTGHAGKRNPNK